MLKLFACNESRYMCGWEEISGAHTNADEVFLDNFLQTIPERLVAESLESYRSMLRSGGRISIIVPNIRSVSLIMLKGKMSPDELFYQHLLGYKNVAEGKEKWLGESPNRSIWEPEKLFESCVAAGFIGVSPMDVETFPLLRDRTAAQCGVTAYVPNA